MANALKLLRTHLGMSQTELGNCLGGLSAARISALECGIAPPTLAFLELLQAMFDCSLDDARDLAKGKMEGVRVEALARAYLARLGGSNHVIDGTDVSGTAAAGTTQAPGGTGEAIGDQSGTGVEGGTRASA